MTTYTLQLKALTIIPAAAFLNAIESMNTLAVWTSTACLLLQLRVSDIP